MTRLAFALIWRGITIGCVEMNNIQEIIGKVILGIVSRSYKNILRNIEEDQDNIAQNIYIAMLGNLEVARELERINIIYTSDLGKIEDVIKKIEELGFDIYV